MSAIGTKRTLTSAERLSACEPNADLLALTSVKAQNPDSDAGVVPAEDAI
jgi:hypothetical protein